MRARIQAKKLAFAIFGWTVAMAAFVFFRYAQTPELPQWAIGSADLATLSIYMGIIFGSLHWMSNLIANFSAINRLPYVFSVLFKGLFLLLGATTLAYITQYLNMWAIENHMTTLRQMLTAHILYSPAFQALIVYLVVVRVGLAFIEQMALLVGPRVLLNIGLGKYHKPRYEQRLFLYLDMVASTTHAESLGDYRFSRLIQDSFSLLADTVTNNEAEIYRYMGDAVLIHWPLKDGIKQDRCFNIYHEFSQQLSWQRRYFEEQYGFVPKFKAAAHCGQVVAAVVGVQKQEISFFSDVLNTLARLQDQCNPLGQRMLISGSLKSRLDYGETQYNLNNLGPIKLKGKQHSIEVFGVTPKNPA
ncbi:adenylate/guanylate cyclase domain-containing protein [Shewanella sp. Choline-02u-19]|uniref:adenylate/guanylate cyclase domain-containing protein n=1 Tax=unclassified Shewanella TaxID=196818 RepID=UPI000C344FFD|nr:MULTISPECIES: adenylate/guanylate cyclase domain-containing protein [unclassified Shewanella]PKG57552.1 adenylate/guanylate cyclase domain-containing protein [Shewanella sp. GutDb-MelDb]PKG76481.1 adenylate/guanylate cyclase domain-containing protein [Shewanella sp. GutCb]PKH57604.1 adenylate/guanylate cyclase domain-containing protein [Shewanella sp. Bg11-22]PKI28465.1 adenylate/guanylate cyclase domain-containing protein [Shewanella sp. Choline-02u-19]